MNTKIIFVSGPVIIEDNNVLLDKHGDDKFWKFCGGKFEDMKRSLIEHAQKEHSWNLVLKLKY